MGFDLLSSGTIFGESYTVIGSESLSEASKEAIASCIVEPRVNKATGEVYEGFQLCFILKTGGRMYHQVDKGKDCVIGEVVDKEAIRFLSLRKESELKVIRRVTW